MDYDRICEWHHNQALWAKFAFNLRASQPLHPLLFGIVYFNTDFTRELKLVSGVANAEGWQPYKDDGNRGHGEMGYGLLLPAVKSRG